MSWWATGTVVASSVYSAYSQSQGLKAQGQELVRQGEQSMLTGHRRVAAANKKAYLDKGSVLEQGQDLIIANYVSSNEEITNATSDASGSGAQISGTVTDVTRSKQVQSSAVANAIKQNTVRNIEGITRDTRDQNAETMTQARNNQLNANNAAHSKYTSSQRALLGGILNAASGGYTAYNRSSTSLETTNDPHTA